MMKFNCAIIIIFLLVQVFLLRKGRDAWKVIAKEEAVNTIQLLKISKRQQEIIEQYNKTFNQLLEKGGSTK